jgi:hypothetical protein
MSESPDHRTKPSLGFLFHPTPHLRPLQNTKFRNAVHSIVQSLDSVPSGIHSILGFHHRYQIKRRRLYDVVNVFAAIGCAVRINGEEIGWHGRDSIFPELVRLKTAASIDDSHLSLAELFPADNCVSLSSLTVSFILLYAALRIEVIDLRRASSFFSRSGGRYKTTLCKLYQIVLILSGVSVTERHSNVCEIKILPPFTQLLYDEKEARPLSIPSLLNHSNDNPRFIEERRAEFAKFLIPHGHA